LSIYLSAAVFFSFQESLFVSSVFVGSSILCVWAIFSAIPAIEALKYRSFVVYYFVVVAVLVLFPILMLFFGSEELNNIVRGILTIPFLVGGLFVSVARFFSTGIKMLLYIGLFVLFSTLVSALAIVGDAFTYLTLIALCLFFLLIVLLVYTWKYTGSRVTDFFQSQKVSFISLNRRILALVLFISGLVGIIIAAIFFVFARDLSSEKNLSLIQSQGESTAAGIQDELDDIVLRIEFMLEQEDVVEKIENPASQVVVVADDRLKNELPSVSFLDFYSKGRRKISRTQIAGGAYMQVPQEVLTANESPYYLYSPENNELYLRYNIVSEQGVLAGFVVAHIDVDILIQSVFELYQEDPGQLYVAHYSGDVASGSGAVLESSQTEAVQACQAIVGECRDIECTEGLSATLTDYFGFSGVESLGYIQLIPELDACVVSEFPEGSLTVALPRTAQIGAVAMFLSLLAVFVFAAYFFARSITRPLKKLEESVNKIKKGQYDVALSVKSNDEISELANAFNVLVKNLKESRQNVNQKINTKTEELEKEKEKLEKTQKAMLNVLQDVNHDKERLSQEKEKIEVIVESINDGFLFVDLKKHIVIFNKAAETISGFNAVDVIGKDAGTVVKLFNQEGIDPFVLDLEEISKNDGDLFLRNVLLLDAVKNYIPIRLSASVVRHNDEIIGYVLIFQDITKEREIEKMKSNFVSIVSHQLRTPLSASKWLLEMLLGNEAGEITEEQKDYLSRAYDSNERMITLVSELLKVSRLESGKIKSEPKEINIKDVIQVVIDAHKVNAQAHNCEIEFAAKDKDIPVIHADPTLVENIVENFVANAIDYANPGKKNTIQIGVKVEKDQLVVAVKDEGIGIKEEDFEKVFGMFYRGDNARKARTDGSGLGLYIARLMVELSGGKIWFESKYQEGSTFYFSLPLT
jgi:PAS domain S-box-containing protein